MGRNKQNFLNRINLEVWHTTPRKKERKKERSFECTLRQDKGRSSDYTVLIQHILPKFHHRMLALYESSQALYCVNTKTFRNSRGKSQGN